MAKILFINICALILGLAIFALPAFAVNLVIGYKWGMALWLILAFVAITRFLKKTGEELKYKDPRKGV